jgi:hypothetical protein
MTNVIEMLKPAIDAASSNPYVAGGMVAAGVLIGIGKWIHDKRKARKK